MCKKSGDIPTDTLRNWTKNLRGTKWVAIVIGVAEKLLNRQTKLHVAVGGSVVRKGDVDSQS